jgi:hypothetical protein
MKKAPLKVTSYVEALARAISNAQPYYIDSKSKLEGGKSRKNVFPEKPGVYIILRRVRLPDEGYITCGVNTKSPLALYVGKTTAIRTIRDRLTDHFGGEKPKYQGSQFRKFLYQVVQDHNAVKRILWSNDTLVASVPVCEKDEVIDAVEKLAIHVFQPRFNIKDR